MSKPSVDIAIILAGFVGVYAYQSILNNKYDYKCRNCGKTFSLPALTAALAPHRFGGQKWVKCPHCGMRSWAALVPKV